MLSQLRYKRIQPLQAHTGTSFANALEFSFTVGSNERLIWDDSFLALKLRVNYHNGTNYVAIPSGDDAVGIANSPLSCFFSDASLRINNREVSRISEYPQGAMIHQLLTHGNAKEEADSCNPIELERRWAPKVTATSEASNAIERVRNAVGLALGTAAEQSVVLAGRLPLFWTKSELDGNISVIVRLVVDPQWRSRILRAAGASTPTASAIGAGAGARLEMDVSSLILNLRMYETDSVPRSVVSKYESTEIFSSTRSVLASTSQRYTFTMPRSVSAIFFCFFDSTNDYSTAPTRFICSASRELTGYEIRYAGTTMPSPKHILSLADAAPDRGENNDAFKGFIHETLDLAPTGSKYGAVEWASQFLGYHQVVKPSGSEAQECTLDLTFANAPTNSVLYFGAFSPRMVEVVYSDLGIVSDVAVSDLIA